MDGGAISDDARSADLASSRKCETRRLGCTDYIATWRAMQAFTDVRASDTPDEIWLTEHAPIYTLGLAGRREHLLRVRPVAGPVNHLRALVDDESVRSKCPDHDADVVATLHQPPLVGKNHPVGLAVFRRGALPQLSDVLHGRDHQLDPGLRVDQHRLSFLIVERLGFVRV